MLCTYPVGDAHTPSAKVPPIRAGDFATMPTSPRCLYIKNRLFRKTKPAPYRHRLSFFGACDGNRRLCLRQMLTGFRCRSSYSLATNSPPDCLFNAATLSGPIPFLELVMGIAAFACGKCWLAFAAAQATRLLQTVHRTVCLTQRPSRVRFPFWSGCRSYLQLFSNNERVHIIFRC